MILRHSSVTGPVLAGLLASSPVLAADEYNVSSGVTYAGVGLGVHGMDTVALAKGGGVQRGLAAHTTVHDGVSYYFATEAAKLMFEAAPETYLPQFGGFCALAVSLGKKFDGNPHYADIVDGKLYLFVNAAVFEAYQKDPAGTIAKAEATWPEIRSTPVSDL